MSKKILIGLVAVIAIAGMFSLGYAGEKVPVKRILIVYSYHAGWGWNQDTRKGLIEGMDRKGYVLGKDYELKEFFMDTKITYKTPAQIKKRAEEAIRIINEYKPDLVVVNDDNALKYVAVPYPDESLTFLFAGINLDPEKAYPEKIESLERPGHNITGVLERFPFYQSFSLARRILPDKNRIVLFGDSSPSSNFLIGAFKKRYLEKVEKSPLEVIGVVQVKTFKQWQEKILEYQAKTDFIGILTYHQLLDEQGRVVHASKVVNWTVEHNKAPEIGFLLFHAEDGFWCAVGVSAYKTGRYLGGISAGILKGEQEASNTPITDPQLLDIAFNLKRSEMLGIKIPIDMLGLATEVYKEIKVRY